MFGSVKLTKIANLNQCSYSKYVLGFDTCSDFSLPDGSMTKNAIIFGADMNSAMHIDNKGNKILILGEGPTKGLDDTTLTTEAK